MKECRISYSGIDLTMRLLIVENSFGDLYKSRYPLGEFLGNRAIEVFYACPNPGSEEVLHIPMLRSSLNFRSLHSGLLAFQHSEEQISPHCTVSFRLMPNVLNFLTSFSNPNAGRILVVTGLGHAFVEQEVSLKNYLLRVAIKTFYRLASLRCQIVVQNPDDAITLNVNNSKLILGSGVVLTPRKKKPDTNGLNLLYVGRLLKSKGIEHSIAVYKSVKKVRPDASLTIAGTIDEMNPDSISRSDLSKLSRIPGVQLLGYVENVDAVYRNSNVLLFLSTYREGVPRAIIEALSHGLTIITTNNPGCKETINQNGFLVQDTNSLHRVIQYCCKLSKQELRENAKNSRSLFESTFSSEVIFPQYEVLIRDRSR